MTGREAKGRSNGADHPTTAVTLPPAVVVRVDSQASRSEGAHGGDLRQRRLFVSLDSERKGHVTLGAAASVVTNLVAHWKSKSALDDTLDVFPCHGVGGMSGMVGTGLFASSLINANGADGLMYGGTTLFLHHVAALIIVAGLVLSISYLLYKVTNWISPLRVDAEHECVGLDISQHGESFAAELPHDRPVLLEPASVAAIRSPGETPTDRAPAPWAAPTGLPAPHRAGPAVK